MSPAKNPGGGGKKPRSLNFNSPVTEKARGTSNTNMSAAERSGDDRARVGQGSATPAAAPLWFQHYERREEERFSEILRRLDFHEKACDERFASLERELSQALDKIDDLENRSRRNNLVFFNLPEGEETDAAGGCGELISSLLSSIDEAIGDAKIERAHRTPPGPPPSRMQQNGSRPKDRPIHVCFGSFYDRVRVRKACIAAFKGGFKYKERKIFVAEDFSQRIQARRKALLPELKKLQHGGKKAFFVYPATIKYVEDNQLKVYKPGV